MEIYWFIQFDKVRPFSYPSLGTPEGFRCTGPGTCEHSAELRPGTQLGHKTRRGISMEPIR